MKNEILRLLNIGLIFIIIALFFNQNKNNELFMKVQNLEDDFDNSINRWSNILVSLKNKIDLMENRS